MKKLVFLLALIFMSSFVAADPVESLGVKSGFEEKIYGGDTQEVNLEFNNSANHTAPLYVRLNISSGRIIEGSEFDVTARLNSSNDESYSYQEMECEKLLGKQYDYRPEEKNLLYSCYSSGSSAAEDMLPDSQNSLNVSIDSDSALAPANFGFSMEVLSRVGQTDEKKIVENQESGLVSFENTSVEFDADDTVDVTAWSYSEVFVDAPDNKQFVEGVDVAVSPSAQRQQQCVPFLGKTITVFDDYVEDGAYWFDRVKCKKPAEKASGQLDFDYTDSMNQSTLKIYRYDLSKSKWKEVDGQSVNTLENYVEVNVNDFSSIALFGEEKQSNDDDSVNTFSSSSSTTFSSDDDSISVTGSGDDGGSVDVNAEFEYITYNNSLNVKFNASGTSSEDGIASYDWDFGDDLSGSGEVENHTYNAAGIYTVNLTVTSDSGISGSEEKIVEVSPVIQEEQITVPDSNNDDDSAQNNPEAQQTPTAQFFSNPSSWNLILSILLLLAAIYVYRDKLKALAVSQLSSIRS